MAAYKNTVDQPWNTILMLLMLNILATWLDVAVKSLAIRVLDTNKLRGMGATVQLIGNNATASSVDKFHVSEGREILQHILFDLLKMFMLLFQATEWARYLQAHSLYSSTLTQDGKGCSTA